MLPDEIKEIIQKATGDREYRSAIIQIEDILENSQYPGIRSLEYQFYLDDNVPPHLLEVKLTLEQQKEVVELIADKIIRRHNVESIASLMLALSKAHRLASVDAVLNLVQNHIETFNESGIYQTLMALELLTIAKAKDGWKKIRPKLKAANLLQMLEKYAAYPSQAPYDTGYDISEVAQRILNRVMVRKLVKK